MRVLSCVVWCACILALLAAGCSDDKPTGPGNAAFVVRGAVTSSGTPVKNALVEAETGAASESVTTDSLGAYMLLFDALPDSVRLCVSAATYIDTCMDALNPPDTLIVNWPIRKIPPKDTIWLSVDTVAAGDTAEVVLYLSNPDSAIAGMNVWLEWPSSDIRYDTVQLSASRIPPSMDWGTGRHDSISNVAILAFDIDGVATISEGRGALMTIRFVVDPIQPAGFVPIDTSTLISPYIQRVSLSYPSGGKAIIPAFLPGGIEVQ